MTPTTGTENWRRILAFYDELESGNPVFHDLAALAHRIHDLGYPAAGLHGLTSMHDLLLGPSSDVIANPFLRVAYDFGARHFVLAYEAGHSRPAARPTWARTATPEEVAPVIEESLTRRARWYRAARRETKVL